ncbi:MAG: hypothetical protein OXF41_16210, partial [bacterium]|nr:hypothetical protein [bacterium]
MSLTDEPDDDLTDQPTSEAPVDEAEEPVPTKSTLWWPVVQALREMGRPATGAEVVDHVADSLNLTQRQRTQMIPAGQQTRLQNRVNWATHELKEIGAVHSPKRGYRALTELGQEIDEERIAALRAEFLSSKSPTEAELAGQQQAETPAAWRIRAGGRGEFAESFIESEIVAVDFGQLPDLSEVSGRDEIAELVSRNSPKLEEEQVRNRARQLWTFRSSVHRGDLVVMPCKDNAQFALGTVRSEYWYRHDSDNMRHAVEVDWRPTPVPRTAVRQDLLRSLETPPTVLAIGQDSAWRLHQLLETGKDPGPRADDDSASVDLSALVERFRAESGYPTEAHEEQERLRAEWAEKLARENVASLTREDLLAYTSNAVDYGQYVDRGEDRHQQWIVDLDDAQYDRLLDRIRDLCWGDDDLSIRIDRLVDRVGGSNRDTGTKGFTGIQV